MQLSIKTVLLVLIIGVHCFRSSHSLLYKEPGGIPKDHLTTAPTTVCASTYLDYLQQGWKKNEVSPEVIHAWEYYRSYYALREIIETYDIAVWHNATQEQIRSYLGEPILGYEEIVGTEENITLEETERRGDENVRRKNAWFYPSVRKVSHESTLMLRFNEQGQIREVGWVKQPLRELPMHKKEGISPLLAHSPYLRLLHNKQQWKVSIADEVRERWEQHASYYALIEILDTYLNPEKKVTVSKEEVRKYLGEPQQYFTDLDSDKDAFDGNLWMYSSSRKVPIGSYLLIKFDENGRMKPQEIFWASE